jgi:hypothetical protein
LPLQLPLQHMPLPLHATPFGSLHPRPGWGQQTFGLAHGVPVQTPFMQTSFDVHALLSLQAVPFGLFWTPQTLFVQVACWH